MHAEPWGTLFMAELQMITRLPWETQVEFLHCFACWEQQWTLKYESLSQVSQSVVTYMCMCIACLFYVQYALYQYTHFPECICRNCITCSIYNNIKLHVVALTLLLKLKPPVGGGKSPQITVLMFQMSCVIYSTDLLKWLVYSGMNKLTAKVPSCHSTTFRFTETELLIY